MDRFLIHIFVYGLLIIRIASGQSVDDEKALIRNMTADYSRNVRPVANRSDALTVYTDVFVISINDYNEVTESFSAIFYLRLRWNDASIQWTPADYKNISYIKLFYYQVWVPAMLLVNPADTSSVIGSLDWRWQRVSYMHDGTSVMNSKEKVHTTCSANVVAYPFDVQTCTSVYYAVGYSWREIIILPDSEQLSMDHYFPSSTWDIIEATQTSVLKDFAYEWRITIKMKRRASFLFINTVLPILVLGLLKNLVYLLPAEDGERASYCITVLLAISVFMTIVSDELPKTSSPISLFTLYLLAELLLNMFTSICVVLNLRLFFRAEQTPVHPTVVRIVEKLSTQKRQSTVEDIYEHKVDADDPHHDGVQQSDTKHKLDTGKVNIAMACVEGSHDVTWKSVSFTVDNVCFILFTFLTVLAFLIFIITVNVIYHSSI